MDLCFLLLFSHVGGSETTFYKVPEKCPLGIKHQSPKPGTNFQKNPGIDAPLSLCTLLIPRLLPWITNKSPA